MVSLTALLDYEPLVSVPLVFTAGSVAGESMKFSVGIVDDMVVEGSEQFSLRVTDSTTSAQPVTGQDLLSVAIIDNDFGKSHISLYCIYHLLTHPIFSHCA